ncbi:hypothetical protein BJV82DRAFT_182199 [Fennellomyces sp. T-0311]|nr:hypothetical protein BJV82DRAFT_182199 [Fennellomyces sp. T-0311]
MTIGESKKRPASSTSTLNKTKRSQSKPPIVATTKATAARAAAIRQASSSSSTTSKPPVKTSKAPIKRKASTTTPPNGPKKRAAWDIRGRMQDMEEQLKKDTDQIGKLEVYRAGLVSTSEEKEIEIKEVIQQIAVAKADLQAVERNNAHELESMKAQQRIHRQELEDTNLILKRKLASLQLEYADAERELSRVDKRREKADSENAMLKKTISETSAAFVEVEEETRAVKLKMERADDTLMEYDRTIEKMTKDLEVDKARLDELIRKSEEEDRTQERLKEKIRELESRREHESKQRKRHSIATQ